MQRWIDPLRRAVRRERDRRRTAATPHAWLFQPYLGDEWVALAWRLGTNATPVASTTPAVTLAAIIARGQRIMTSRSWVVTLTDDVTPAPCPMQRRHELLYAPDAVVPGNRSSFATLAEFIGNRPLVGWQLGQGLAALAPRLRRSLGFELPNSRVDLAALHRRYLRRLHPHVDVTTDFTTALACWQIDEAPSCDLRREAVAAALLYLRFQQLSRR